MKPVLKHARVEALRNNKVFKTICNMCNLNHMTRAVAGRTLVKPLPENRSKNSAHEFPRVPWMSQIWQKNARRSNGGGSVEGSDCSANNAVRTNNFVWTNSDEMAVVFTKILRLYIVAQGLLCLVINYSRARSTRSQLQYNTSYHIIARI